MAIGKLTLDEVNEENMKLAMRIDEDDCVACNFDLTLMSDLLKKSLPVEGFVKIKQEVKMVKYFESPHGNIYVLNTSDGRYNAINIETGCKWGFNCMTESAATDRLTEIKGEITFKKKTQHLKSAQDIMKILVDDGYKVNVAGYWTKHCEKSFMPKFWQYCGQENPGFILDEGWVEYK